MFWKFVVLILSIGIIGGALLTMRQLRIQAAHELGAVQRRVGDRDRELWRLRIEIARTIRPDAVQARLLSVTGEVGLSPIGLNSLADLWPLEDAGRPEVGRAVADANRP